MSLQSIYERFQMSDSGGDKGTLHSYIDVYGREIPVVVGKSLLEIGVYQGHSLKMWRAYLPSSRIVGIDISFDNFSFSQDDLELICFDATKPQVLDFVTGSFDYVIDDGSHKVLDQKTTFDLLWDRVLRGGKYFIEDIVGLDEAVELQNHVRIMTGLEAVIYDLRENKGRFDDILLQVNKPM